MILRPKQLLLWCATMPFRSPELMTWSSWSIPENAASRYDLGTPALSQSILFGPEDDMTA